MFSTRARYALRVMIDIAQQKSDDYIPLKDIAMRQDLSKKYLEDVDTKAVTIFQPASSLSGGNQQKVVVAKALAQSNMKVIIMDEPTKGIDVGAKKEIYEIMNEFAEKGFGIVMISSEMPEIIGMCDRIFVMRGGRISGCLDRSEATQEKILEYSMEQTKGGDA